jgi:peptidoglycan L-alanyl-D-glutamate endopeptidase CwlK
MTFALSQRSKNNLMGVHPKLVQVVGRAIELTKVDFGVTSGIRTQIEQEQLVAAGKSQTMKSKHLRQADGYGHAVDLVAWIHTDGGSHISWELNVYDDIADAMKKAARDIGLSIRWGAAWNIDDLTVFSGSAEEAMMSYIDLRRSQGRRPWIDAPHFELTM